MMQGLSPVVYEHKYLFSPVRIAVVLVGFGALALVASNVVPLLTAMLGMIYGFFVPAWLLSKLVVRRLPELQPFAASVVALAALAPFWLIVLSVIWVFDNRLTEWQVAGLLALTIMSVTIALVRRLPFTVTIGIHSIIRRWSPNFGFFAAGLILGLIIALITQIL
jgi:hypothetical protein